MANLVSHIFVNFAPVADGEDLDRPVLSIDLVDNAKSSNLVFPQPGQFAKQRLAGARFPLQAAEKGSPASLRVHRLARRTRKVRLRSSISRAPCI
jgi:hypothetical protein